MLLSIFSQTMRLISIYCSLGNHCHDWKKVITAQCLLFGYVLSPTCDSVTIKFCIKHQSRPKLFPLEMFIIPPVDTVHTLTDFQVKQVAKIHRLLLNYQQPGGTTWTTKLENQLMTKAMPTFSSSLTMQIQIFFGTKQEKNWAQHCKLLFSWMYKVQNTIFLPGKSWENPGKVTKFLIRIIFENRGEFHTFAVIS